MYYRWAEQYFNNRYKEKSWNVTTGQKSFNHSSFSFSNYTRLWNDTWPEGFAEIVKREVTGEETHEERVEMH